MFWPELRKKCFLLSPSSKICFRNTCFTDGKTGKQMPVSARMFPSLARGPFLESLGNLTGPKSFIEIKFSRKVGCVLTSNKVHFVSEVDDFTLKFSKLEWKTKQLNGPGNYRELREMGPRTLITTRHSITYQDFAV